MLQGIEVKRGGDFLIADNFKSFVEKIPRQQRADISNEHL